MAEMDLELPFTAHPLGPKLTTPTITAVSSVALAGTTKGPPESPLQESLLVPSEYPAQSIDLCICVN